MGMDHVCFGCGVHFTGKRRKKSKHVFCSSACQAKYGLRRGFNYLIWFREKGIPDPESWLRDKYENEMLSSYDIADIMGITATGVLNIMGRYGIPIRNTSEAKINAMIRNPQAQEKSTQALMEYRASESDEDRRKRRMKCDESLRLYRQNIAPERRAEISRKISQSKKRLYASYTDEKLKEAMKPLQLGHARHIASLDDAGRRAMIAKANSAFWEKMKNEDFKSNFVRKCFASQTKISKPEIALTDALDQCNMAHEKQYNIAWFFIDIAMPEYKLAIHVDGEYWHSLPERIKKDKIIDAYLKAMGWVSIRFPASEVHEDPMRFVGTIRSTIYDILGD